MNLLGVKYSSKAEHVCTQLQSGSQPEVETPASHSGFAAGLSSTDWSVKHIKLLIIQKVKSNTAEQR